MSCSQKRSSYERLMFVREDCLKSCTMCTVRSYFVMKIHYFYSMMN